MIEMLKSDELMNKVGGQFKLAALIQKRSVELMQGARPLVDPEGRTLIEIAVQELLEDKIAPADPAAGAQGTGGSSDD